MRLSTASTPERIYIKENTNLKTTCCLFFIVWIWTLIDVADMVNWTLENTPVFLFTGILVLTYDRYKFSDLSYILIFTFLALHIFGAKYTYAENPFGEWLQQELGSKRNHYDRIVHFLFGFLLAYPMRELCLRYFNFSPKVSNGIPIIVCLALGGFYEIVEGVVVGVFFPEQGLNFLGIQGDLWDPQKDIALAWLGSVGSVAVIELYKYARRYLPKRQLSLRV
ncbi:MAG TPA: DUF2238 domain-containing protein [Cytophagaceae bacterium]|jgi:putative membrane protein